MIRCLLPKRRIPEKKEKNTKIVLKTMFPGYLLINVKMDFCTYYEIIKIPNVISLLTYNNKKDRTTSDHNTLIEGEANYFKALPSEEVNLILKLIDDNDIVEFSKAFFDGEKLVIESGPLRELSCSIKKIEIRKSRAKISLNFMETQYLMDVGILITREQ